MKNNKLHYLVSAFNQGWIYTAESVKKFIYHTSDIKKARALMNISELKQVAISGFKIMIIGLQNNSIKKISPNTNTIEL